MKRILLLLLCVLCPAHLGWADTVVRLGANPNIWFPHAAVIIGEGWDRQAGLRIEQKIYPGPAHNLQGLISGEVDGVTNNVAAALLARERGKALTLVAGTTLGDISLIVQPPVLQIAGSSPLEKLKRFTATHGRRFRLVTNPRGSLSEITMRRWLETSWPQFESGIELIHAGDQATLQQLFFSGAADGCAGFGSLLWLFQAKNPAIAELLTPEQLMTDQPGGALALSDEWIARHPELVPVLQELFRRATDLIRTDPERAAAHVDALLTNGLVPLPILSASLRERRRFIESDLSKLESSTMELSRYMVRAGYLTQPPDLATFFYRAPTAATR